MVSGSSAVSTSVVSHYYRKSLVSQSSWWCPALRPCRIHLFPLKGIHLSPSLAGDVRLSGHLELICFPLKEFICLKVWLVVSGSSAVSNSFVSPYHRNSFVSQSGWWCPALWPSRIHLFPLIGIDLFPSLAGGVRLSGRLEFICPPL